MTTTNDDNNEENNNDDNTWYHILTHFGIICIMGLLTYVHLVPG